MGIQVGRNAPFGRLDWNSRSVVIDGDALAARLRKTAVPEVRHHDRVAADLELNILNC
jgi:hypothetical protein